MKRKNKDLGNGSIENTGGELMTAPYEKPLVCLFDFNKQTVEATRNARFNVHDSSLGSPVLMPQGNRYGRTLFLLNHNWPFNIHEYDIFVVDMARGEGKRQIKERVAK